MSKNLTQIIVIIILITIKPTFQKKKKKDKKGEEECNLNVRVCKSTCRTDQYEKSKAKYVCPTDRRSYCLYPVCARCISNCINCDNPITCDQCKTGYKEISGIPCAKCFDGNCLECSGINQGQCLKCSSGSFLKGGECFTNCGSGMFGNTQTGTCEFCHEDCEKCFGSTQEACLICKYPLHMDVDGFKCAETCVEGSYSNESLDNPRCLPCHKSCKSCFGGSETQCLECFETDFRKGNLCKQTCGERFYGTVDEVTGDNICKQCFLGCAQCSGPLESECSRCYLPYNMNLEETSCITDCGNAFKNGNSFDPRCLPCHESCLKCKERNENDCLECPPGEFLKGGRCVPECGEKYYGVLTLVPECKECLDECKECSGPNLADCSKCVFPFHLSKSGAGCQINCEESYSNQDELDPKCLSCDISCSPQLCTGPAAGDCYSCLPNEAASDGTCLIGCPDGYYEGLFGAVKVCLKCALGCVDCSGPTQGECIKCGLPFHMSMHENKCVEDCFESYGNQDPNEPQCKECDKNCLDCSGEKKDECTSCKEGKFFYQGKCDKKCPEGLTGNLEARSCDQCSENCDTCFNIFETGCINCKPGLVKRFDSSCGDPCPEGSYPFSIESPCVSCHESCKGCIGGSDRECIDCKGDLVLNEDFSCTETCKEGTYEALSKICKKCKSTCVTCSNGRDCDSCPRGKLLRLDKSCENECSIGSYMKNDKRKCGPCPQYCDECAGPGQGDCVKCSERALTHQDDLSCYPICKPNYHQLPELPICVRCPPTCKTCSGPESNNCLSCYETAELNLETGTCETKKKLLFDGDNYVNCHSTCVRCLGELETDCTACNPGDYLHPDYTCKSHCPENTYTENVDNYFVCHDCNPRCDGCVGPEDSNCKKCQSGFGLSYFELDPLNKTGRCIDCSLEYADFPQDCTMVRGMTLKKMNYPVDGFSAISIKVDIGPVEAYIERLRKLKLDEYIYVQFEVLELYDDFDYKFDIIQSEIFLSLNFTEEGGSFELMAYPFIASLLHHLDKNNKETSHPELVIKSEDIFITLDRIKQESSELIKQYSANSISTAGESTSSFMNFILSISILASAGGLISGILTALKTFKLIYMLKLINVFYGNILEAFLETLGASFNQNRIANDQDLRYMMKTSGKLSFNRISVISNNYLYVQYMLYLATKLASIFHWTLKSKVPNPQKLTKIHFIAYGIIDSMKNSIFYSTLNEVALYSVHEILHHDLTVEQDSLAKLSYLITVLVFTLVVYDLIYIIMNLFYLKPIKLKKSQDWRKNLEVIVEDDATSLKEKVNCLRIQEIFEKNFSYYFGVSRIYLVLELNPDKLKSFWMKAPKLFSILKFTFFGILINSLQNLNRLQVIVIFLIQISHLIYLVIVVFCKKVYSKMIFGIIELTTELCLTFFLIVGLVLEFIPRNKMSLSFYTILQTGSIFLILIGTLANVISAIISLILVAIKIHSVAKFGKKRKKILYDYKKIHIEGEEVTQKNGIDNIVDIQVEAKLDSLKEDFQFKLDKEEAIEITKQNELKRGHVKGGNENRNLSESRINLFEKEERKNGLSLKRRRHQLLGI